MVKYAREVNYQKQKEIVNNQIINKLDSCYIITNNAQKNLGEYYNIFRNDKFTYLNFNSFDFRITTSKI